MIIFLLTILTLAIVYISYKLCEISYILGKILIHLWEENEPQSVVDELEEQKRNEIYEIARAAAKEKFGDKFQEQKNV